MRYLRSFGEFIKEGVVKKVRKHRKSFFFRSLIMSILYSYKILGTINCFEASISLSS